MNRFIIVDGLPYLYANSRVFSVRWDDKGFTVGNEVKLAVIPSPLYSEIEVQAKCLVLDSIGAVGQSEKTAQGKSRGRKKVTE